MLSTVKSQVSLPTDVDKYLRDLGHGRLSMGIFIVATLRMQSAMSEPEPQSDRPAKPLTATQRKAAAHREQSRNQAVLALQEYARRENLTADSPDLLEAVEQYGLGITMDDIVPAPVAAPVDDTLLDGWD